MNESFLQQLEQRTEQVKITLANLEAERVRIEAHIARLQPIVPHYDALLAAERSLAESEITLDNASLASEAPADQPADAPQQSDDGGWYEQHAASSGEGEEQQPEQPQEHRGW